MVDFSKYHITKPKNMEELYEKILLIVEPNYQEVTPYNVKNRKNKIHAKMSDAQIITIRLLIETLGKSQKSGYDYLKANFPNLVTYAERSRFNRLLNSLFTVIKAIRRRITETRKDPYQIVDSFPITINKFGRAYFGKRLRTYSSYGYCASKKEHYYGMKVHVITALNGEPLDYLVTRANVDDRDVLFELTAHRKIDNLLADKGYVGTIAEELKEATGTNLYTLKRENSKNPLPKSFRNMISKLRRRIETTFGSLFKTLCKVRNLLW